WEGWAGDWFWSDGAPDPAPAASGGSEGGGGIRLALVDAAPFPGRRSWASARRWWPELLAAARAAKMPVSTAVAIPTIQVTERRRCSPALRECIWALLCREVGTPPVEQSDMRIT